MAVSIRDVAKSAGVSVSTVSRALNGYSDVNEDTRKKIQKTVEELGYMPNQSAKNLSSKSKKNIALIICDIEKEEKLDEFTGNILKGVYEFVNEKGMTIATYGINTRMQREKTLKDLCDRYSLSRYHAPGNEDTGSIFVRSSSHGYPLCGRRYIHRRKKYCNSGH